MPTTRTMISFGYWIRRQRQALDLTQAALAQLIGCAKVTISKLERDERRPSRQMAELLAEYLAVPNNQRAYFLAATLGDYAVDGLPLANQPVTPPGVATVPGSQFSFAAFPAPVHSNLPAPTTPLVGRDEELAQLAALLTDSLGLGNAEQTD